MKTYTELTMPFRPLPELRQEIEAFLHLLCKEAEREQQANRARPQMLNMRMLRPIAWVDQLRLPVFWRCPGYSVFGLHTQQPASNDPHNQWALLGRVQEVAYCTCGKRVCQEQGATPSGEDGADAEECSQCRYRFFVRVNPQLPFDVAEVVAAIDHYLCHDEHLAPLPAPPWPTDSEHDGFASLEQPDAEDEQAKDEQAKDEQAKDEQAKDEQAKDEQAEIPPPAPNIGSQSGRTMSDSTVQLEQWLRGADNPKHYKPFFEAWVQLRRNEPGFDDILDQYAAFKRVAERCLDRIYKR